ncbi:serine/threonine-protein kinase [Streptomyces sp. enrichment culture]|uniref:serine/threonine-protein kinase n=1 Tax=Streptomyces sp. enrichment culture TaxID=1795815 RepID=UPI003F54EBDD
MSERVRDGHLVDGRYRLAGRLGSGGSGTVWRAFDELAGRQVALRRPRLPYGKDGEPGRRAANRVYREARVAARVEHPSAVAIHDVVVEDGRPWVVMEWVRGECLRDLLARGPLPVAECARVGLAVLGALRAAHSVGIVHRDVRPANVLVEQGTGRVVLTGFGVAPATVGEYAAPERRAGREAGPASDLWSLGALLHAAAQGGPPAGHARPAGPLGPLISALLSPHPDRRPTAARAATELAVLAGERPAAAGRST